LACQVIFESSTETLRRPAHLFLDFCFIIGGLHAKAAVLEQTVGFQLVPYTFEHSSAELLRVLRGVARVGA